LTVQTKIRRIEELEREVGQKQAEIEQLRGKAKQYVDYDEIKRELEIMKVCRVYLTLPGLLRVVRS
jgi:predicted RNase H-like nuclease (RuvC/YqgF family)